MMKRYLLIVSLLTLPSLSACESTREQFDFSKKAPDEFAVTTRAPLEMPPTYTLPKPRPGAPRPQEKATTVQAAQAIFGSETPATAISAPTAMSSGEAALLQQSGASEANASIRDAVDAETQELVKENTSTVDRLLGKVGRKADVPTTVVDPIKEAERLKQNREAGAPVTTGETPSFEE